MKKIFLLTFVFSLFVVAQPAFADDPYFGLDQTAQKAGLQQNVEAPVIIGNVIGNILTLIGVIFFVLMVYGGFLWMTAHGESSQVDKAKETIIAAVIGMVVVLASYALTSFILSAPTGGSGASSGGGAGGNGAGDTSQCEATGPGWSCRDRSECGDESIIGICPGGNNIICCQAANGGGDEADNDLDFGGNACNNNADCEDGFVCSDGACAVGNAPAPAAPAPAPAACVNGQNRAQCIAINGCSWVSLNGDTKCVEAATATRCQNEAQRCEQGGCNRDPACLAGCVANQRQCLGL